jgi:hypothetical protein
LQFLHAQQDGRVSAFAQARLERAAVVADAAGQDTMPPETPYASCSSLIVLMWF